MADADFEIIDRSFRHCVKTSAEVDLLWTGARWTEGPAWFEAHRSLVFSDIPNDRLLRFDATTGEVGTLREGQARFTNGNTVDRQGRLISCEHGTRQVTRTEHDGTITVLCDRFAGKRFNSPNDVVVRADDTIWFTDPAYGIDSDYEGRKGESEIGGNHVFRLNPKTGELRQVTTDFVRPNGLAFSPDERTLYIVDSGGSYDDDGPRHLRAFRVGDDGGLAGGEVIATCACGVYDGFRVDTEGRIWTSAADGVHCLAPDGTLLGKIYVPERVANLCFGGSRRNVMFITATTSLYGVRLPVNGVKTY